ncbi:MAG TPA: NAD(+)/NADH kinase [Fervidicoccus fontis]|uniref:NAD kinase n=1 Tax=Fervidicoccus fontis TaxID=683846 RepID=A0A7C2UR95_9CREN|nr:NAD(+)/NADH kinase [Fervidicoccus fontis]
MSSKCSGTAIFINPESREAWSSLLKLVTDFERFGEEVFLASESSVDTRKEVPIKIVPIKGKAPCWTIVIGGDGTLLRAIRHEEVRRSRIVTVGAGRRCYYFDITTEEIAELVKKIKTGMFIEQHLWMLKAEGDSLSEDFLNELVVAGEGIKVIELSVSIDGDEVYRLVGDGVIIATASGSTAYSLSAGGPIVDPFLSSIVITPLNSMTLYARPIVVDPFSIVEIKILRKEGRERLILDGQKEIPVPDSLFVRLNEKPLRFARLKQMRFYERVLKGGCGSNI